MGSHLTDYILARSPEYEIVGITRWRSPKDNIRHILDKITLEYGDLLDLSSVQAVLAEHWLEFIFLARRILDLLPAREVFFLEYDGFPAVLGAGLFGHTHDGYFVDIGTPAGFAKAESDFGKGFVKKERKV